MLTREMIRLRLKKFVNESELERDGYTVVAGSNGVSYYTKTIGKYEIQFKKTFPSNVRIKDWDDNRVPWILMRFLLDLETFGTNPNNQLKVTDKGRFYILDITDTLELIKELNKYTDIHKRLRYWYDSFMEGKINF